MAGTQFPWCLCLHAGSDPLEECKHETLKYEKTRLAALMLLPILLVTSFVIACGETVTELIQVVVEKEVQKGETVETIEKVIVQKEGETVVQTVVVEKEVPVEVVQTVVVEKEIIVEKTGETVVQTVVVEKEGRSAGRPDCDR